MNKKINEVSLTLITNDECEMMATRKAMNGALVIDEAEKTARFTESAPKPSRQRNTKVYDGVLLSMVVKSDGVYRVHTKEINPLVVDDFVNKMNEEAIAVLEKAEENRR